MKGKFQLFQNVYETLFSKSIKNYEIFIYLDGLGITNSGIRNLIQSIFSPNPWIYNFEQTLSPNFDEECACTYIQ